MLDVSVLESHFYPVIVDGRLARAADELRDGTIYRHFLLPVALEQPHRTYGCARCPRWRPSGAIDEAHLGGSDLLLIHRMCGEIRHVPDRR
jgi:hypothetical protein